MTTFEKMKLITPYQQTDFIRCESEHGYQFSVNIYIVTHKKPPKLPNIRDDIEVELDLAGRGCWNVFIYSKTNVLKGEEDKVTLDDLLDTALDIIKENKLKQ